MRKVWGEAVIVNASAFALPLKGESVHCIVTSPPYWGLRKYSGLTGEQFGLEPTLELYIEHSMLWLDECWRVMRPDATLWVNIGDSYCSQPTGSLGNSAFADRPSKQACFEERKYSKQNPKDWGNLKPKDLCLVPFRFALAAQERGWWVRSAIVWAKPNPMPESVTDRPTDAYEHIFLMTRAAKYWYDAEAVREKFADERMGNPGGGGQYAKDCPYPNGGPNQQSGLQKGEWNLDGRFSGRNLRNVWTFATQPYAEAHFATFPEELPRRCILAGCPEKVCAKCGTGWVRILETEDTGRGKLDGGQMNEKGVTRQTYGLKQLQESGIPQKKTLGWKAACDCGTRETAKGVCLDPFAGSGTVVDVALRAGREGIGVELSKEYLKLAQKRTENSRKQGVLL